MRILFILKYREQPYACDDKDWSYSYSGAPLSSGLFNSANMVVKMLNDIGHEAKLVHAQDGNSIHRLCVEFKPDLCIIEAFWCPPYKFDDLYKVLPNLKFVVRNHSETPFLANEGIAFGWNIEYSKKPNVYVAPNSKRMFHDNEILFDSLDIPREKILYLPNFYYFGEHGPLPSIWKEEKEVLDIGCFGAIRPLKNHMMQAIAAIKVADKWGKKLRFHINGNRVEGKGDPILKNLRQTFEKHDVHELVEWDWTDAKEFRSKLKGMDAVLQVSFSETFNIVAADATDAGVPVVGSKEIVWLTDCAKAEPTNVDDIAYRLEIALGFRGPGIVFMNRRKLISYNNASIKAWEKVLSEFNPKPKKKWKF